LKSRDENPSIFFFNVLKVKMSVKNFKHELQSLLTNPNPAGTGGKKLHVHRCRLAGL
jgi:hypothetical protein